MNKKRIFQIILTLIFSFLLISIYSLFKGIPFGSYIAKAKITDYVEQVYGINKSVSKPQFNFEDSSYEVYLPQLGSQFSYDLLHNLIVDEKLANELNNEFQSDYNKLKDSYRDNIELPDAHLFSSVLADGEYSKNMSLYQKIYLLGIINREKITSEDSSKTAATLTKEIIEGLGENYNITSLQVIYTDLNGQYEITLDSKKPISIKTLGKNTSKMEQIGEEDKELIRELNGN
ncbi:YfjL-like protein [Rossellomorea vietnamensis]|uniref:YfjL-like N-terminal domain-containing protein n=1 Tax=Rossellomorea vietnamensis TaxID=218284 RepID=A0A0P6VY30_9BACI|nr:hypothetical protein [Rossellomorea vietnamensis]KPL57744.1 hypothetical protein AM506_20575 [Rossellomorea vietnamensis]